MDTRPIWFLDVDGVLNVFGSARSELLRGRKSTFAIDQLARTQEIIFDPSIIARINAIATSGAVEMRWLTTWGTHARRSLAPAIGLVDFEAETDRESFFSDVHAKGSKQDFVLGPNIWPNPTEVWWKRHLASQWLRANPGRTVIWTDDDLSDLEKESLLADFPGLPNLLITPLSNPALTHDDLDLIQEFASQANRP